MTERLDTEGSALLFVRTTQFVKPFLKWYDFYIKWQRSPLCPINLKGCSFRVCEFVAINPSYPVIFVWCKGSNRGRCLPGAFIDFLVLFNAWLYYLIFLRQVLNFPQLHYFSLFPALLYGESSIRLIHSHCGEMQALDYFERLWFRL